MSKPEMNEPEMNESGIDEPKDSRFDNPRRDREDDERGASTHRHGNFLAVVCFLLVICIAGMVWYAYPTLKASDASLHNLPSLTERFNQTVNSMGDQVKEAEAKVGDSLRAQQSLRAQVRDLGQNLRARIDAASKEASQSAEEGYRRLEAKLQGEMKSQSDGMTTVTQRVSNVESSHVADEVQIAQLQQQLNQAREQAEQRAAQQSEDQALVRRQIDEGHTTQGEELAALKRQLEGVANQNAVRKIGFEASRDQSRDLADGITLHVESTNPAVRQVSGWMWIGGDSRSIWLRNQSAQEPVIFYGNRDGQKRELVFTNVTPNSVTGYLLLPKEGRSAALNGADGNAGASAQ